VSALLPTHGVEHLDRAPFFDRAGDPPPLWMAADDARPNAPGRRLIAEYTLPFVCPRDGMAQHGARLVARAWTGDSLSLAIYLILAAIMVVGSCHASGVFFNCEIR